jgi:hypothetical protein
MIYYLYNWIHKIFIYLEQKIYLNIHFNTISNEDIFIIVRVKKGRCMDLVNCHLLNTLED